MLDLADETDELWDELVAAVAGVLRSGCFVLGPSCAAFEREAAAYLGCRHAVGVNSGTDALVIGLRAAGVRPGEEVVTTPFTFFATAEAISTIGAVPVFADVEPATLNIDPVEVERSITSRTGAIVPVHLFGRPARMDRIMAVAGERIPVVEDAAQAFGARLDARMAGTAGVVGAFSFFPSKPLGGCGDGGLVVTDDDEVAALVRMLRAHGARRKHHNEVLGYNSRLDELQAAILRVKLRRVDEANEGRRRVARRYGELLAGVPGLVLPPPAGSEAVFHQYTVRVLDGRRDELRRALLAAGIDAVVHYPVPVHRLPVYEGLGVVLPEAERAAAEVLSLPLWPTMPDAAVERVASSIDEALRVGPGEAAIG